MKSSGELVPFKRNKIQNSVIRAGASRKLAKEVAREVGKKVSEGMQTNKILDLTLKNLEKTPEIRARYDLKRSMMMLGPSGFPFEEFFSQVLENYDYKTLTGAHIKGRVIFQEIDIIAEKNLRHMIEAKYHNKNGIYTDTKVAMYTYARFLDIKSNKEEKFDSAWLVTNTKCTDSAKKYSKGVGLKVISWGYPKKENLQKLIEKKALYPITVLKLPRPVKERLFEAKIMLLKDLQKTPIDELEKLTLLDKKTLQRIILEANNICDNHYNK